MPPCNIIPMQTQAIESSLTPACKKPPAKFVREIGVVCAKKPSVLSELQRSAELTIILGTYSDNKASTAFEPSRVALLGFCSNLSQGISGNF